LNPNQPENPLKVKAKRKKHGITLKSRVMPEALSRKEEI
jgi:hypothetical protein